MRTRYQCMAIALMCCSISVMAAAAAPPLALTSARQRNHGRDGQKRHCRSGDALGVDHVHGR